MKNLNIVLFNDDGVSNISQQLVKHEGNLRSVLTDSQIKALAYVEGALVYGTVEDAERSFARLDQETQSTEMGQALARRISQVRDDASWWDRVHIAMRTHLGGKTRMSRSGGVIIFATAQCGRHDLASWKQFAQAQLFSAGIVID